MKKTIMDSVMLSRFAKWAGRVFKLNLFKKKSCGASLCKSEKKVVIDEELKQTILKIHGIKNTIVQNFDGLWPI